MYKTIHLLLIFIIFSFSVHAQSAFNFWKPAQETATEKHSGHRAIVPNAYTAFDLDVNAMQEALSIAPMRHTNAARNSAIRISIPMPDGSMQAFRVVEAPVLHPDLAARYPGIRSYAGYSDQDATAYLRFDITPKGLHAMILSGQHSRVFIDPYYSDSDDRYVVYYTKDYDRKDAHEFECGVDNEVVTPDEHITVGATQGSRGLVGDCTLRKYRLALACTGEYAAFHGGTVPEVLAAMNTSMMRVNGVYERDASITMEIIANNDEIIFLDGNSDPYTNGSGATMLGENQATIDDIIGIDNYDIGHVFSTGGGGIASLNSPCSTRRAQGVTGQGSPVGDFFDIDYVAHEMGHQFGANHTQNNDCNRVTGASVEPGSASTIMGYAGICAPNVQSNSDDHFHVYSLREIEDFVVYGNGNTCSENIPLTNNAPTADAGANYTLPISTPFELRGAGSDADDTESLLYCWEQMDAEVATMPPVSTSQDGPSFRSYSPSGNPNRVCPPLENIINNTAAEWDVLPAVSRTMNFTLTVRDNEAGGGCVADDDMLLTFDDNAGPFVVNSPNTTTDEWFVGQLVAVTWDVANTDMAPVNCSNVTILLSTDGGYTYPISLAENVPNTGTNSIVVPNELGDQCRVKVEAVDNIFFDISNENFTIALPPSPDFFVSINPELQQLCNPDMLDFEINIQTLLDFDEEIMLSAEGVPSGVTATFSQDTITGTGIRIMHLENLGVLSDGVYTITVNADATSIQKSTSTTLELTFAVPQAVQPISPADGQILTSNAPELQWQNDPLAVQYHLEVATNPSFETAEIILDEMIDSSTYQLPALGTTTVYYWRLRAENICGDGTYGETFAFQTPDEICESYSSYEAIEISSSGTPFIESLLTVDADFIVSKMTVDSLSIEHSWVGDIDATLIAPTGVSALLFDQLGVDGGGFGCNGSNLLLSFDDDAAATADDLENSCGTGIPSVEGVFQPIESLANFNNVSPAGDWSLLINDNANQDGGQLLAWSLTFCQSVAIDEELNYANDALIVAQSGEEQFMAHHINAFSPGVEDADIVFVILTLPQYGTLELNGVQVQVGDTFTQADIDAQNLTYIHGGSDMPNTDSFSFDILASNNAWLHHQSAFITIVDAATLTANLEVTQGISCFGENDGVLNVNVIAGNPPYQYSLNGMDFQNEPLFTNLASGTYTVSVQDILGTVTTNEVVLASPTEITGTPLVDGNTITVNAMGGTGTLTYSLNDGDVQTENVFINLIPGEYTIIAEDENGCTLDWMVDVIGIPLSATDTILQGVECAGDNSGEVAILADGGILPYTYSIDGVNYQDDNTFDGLGIGDYIFYVKDALDSIYTTEVTLGSYPPLDAGITVNDNSVEITASGGSGMYVYALDNGDFESENTFSMMNNGAHTVTILDEVTDCFFDFTFNINIITSISYEYIDPTCELDGFATLMITEVAGGAPPYEFSVDGGDFTTETTFDYFPVGTTTIEVRDANGYIYTEMVIVTEPDPLAIEVDLGANEEIIITATGGFPPYLYSIDGGVTVGLENIFTGVGGGSYPIVVSDANGCTVETTFYIDAVRSNDFSDAITLFPNPTKEMIFIEFGQVISTDINITILGLLGQNFEPVNVDEISTQKYSLNVQDLPSGTYLCRIKTDKYEVIKKFVKM